MVRLHVSPFVPLEQIRDEFDRVFKNFFGKGVDGNRDLDRGDVGRGFPALNMWEEQEALKIEAEVPGLKQEDLEISVLGSELAIEGKLIRDQVDGTYHRRERVHGEFRRVVRLPFDVDAEKVEAKLSDGVLLITLPKAAAAKPQKIKVSSN